MYIGAESAFEVVQGVLDLLMTKIGAKYSVDYSLDDKINGEVKVDPMYFPKRGANIFLGGKAIGSIGVLHPTVLEKYHLKHPVTCFEVKLGDLFDFFKAKSKPSDAL